MEEEEGREGCGNLNGNVGGKRWYSVRGRAVKYFNVDQPVCIILLLQSNRLRLAQLVLFV
jgi:hypothetical protein